MAARFQESLKQARYGAITTEVAPAVSFYYAEPHHQQYLEANPRGVLRAGRNRGATTWLLTNAAVNVRIFAR